MSTEYKQPELIVIPPTEEYQPPTKLIVINSDHLYCGYTGSTSQVANVQDEWQPFPYPSTGIQTWRNRNFDVSTSGTVALTYQGSGSRWFRISAVCNVFKTVAGGASRKLEVIWHLNGSPVGIVRQTHLGSLDSMVVSATGQLLLANGDVLTPYIRNIENSEPVMLDNCTFDIQEELPIRL